MAVPARGDAPEVVRLLLDAGPDVTATTTCGASARDVSRVPAARSRRNDAGRATAHDELAELLVARGATDREAPTGTSSGGSDAFHGTGPMRGRA